MTPLILGSWRVSSAVRKPEEEVVLDRGAARDWSYDGVKFAD
jgi:hypothetical protein